MPNINKLPALAYDWEIHATSGEHIILDDDMRELFARSWQRFCLNRDKRKRPIAVVVSGYVKTPITHIIMGSPPPVGYFYDHINRNCLDNRRDNLRVVSHSQNMFNRTMNYNNTSNYIGVVWFKRDKNWRALIRHAGKRLYLGTFADPIEAAKAYDNKCKELRGEYAVLNFQ